VSYFPPMPFNREKSKAIARDLAFLGYQLIRFRPNILAEVAQAEIDIVPDYYPTLALLSALYQGAIIFGLTTVLIWVLKRMELIWLTILVGLVVFGFSLFRNLAYPAFIVRQRVKSIERDLLYALRHLSIQVKGGSPVFNAIVSVAEAGYGTISDEFARVVQEVNTGESIESALEQMALRNPSLYLRRAVWQIVNALRTGTDMGKTLSIVVEHFTGEQRVLLQKFAKELGPWAMMYMMLTVIFPTLSITLFLIISSLSQLQLSESALLGFVVVSGIVQYFFMQMLKQKRPAMRW